MTKKTTFFHLGEARIDHAEGSAHPKKTFTVSEAEGKKLKKLYPRILQTVSEAAAPFQEPVTAPAPEEKKPAEKTAEELEAEQAAADAEEALKKEADEAGMTMEELKQLKALEAKDKADNANTGF